MLCLIDMIAFSQTVRKDSVRPVYSCIIDHSTIVESGKLDMKRILGLIAILALSGCNEEETTGEPPVRGLKTHLVADSEASTVRRFPSVIEPTALNILSFDTSGKLLEVNLQVRKEAKLRNILVNVADNPPYCDFYMGGIVSKGNLKIAISTNGKSPTLAKRLRQLFEEVIPETTDELLENLNTYRKTLKGDFEEKVDKLNELTRDMIRKGKDL